MERIGPIKLVQLWLVVAVVVVGMLGMVEWQLRARGFRPSVVDTLDLWAYHRNRIGEDPRQLVLVGASRIRLGFVPEVYLDRWPNWKFTNLAVDGKHPVATLRALAADTSFRGTVLCSISAAGIDSQNWHDQSAYPLHASKTSVVGPINAFGKAVLLQTRSTVFGQQLDWRSLLTRLLSGKPLVGPPVVTLPNRCGRAAYPEKLYEEQLQTIALEATNQAADPQRWLRDAGVVATLADHITARGGRVIFIRYPESGQRYQRICEQYPRAIYWDHFAGLTSCQTIHFEDYPQLSCFELPDDSHLNYRDAIEFTRRLMPLLQLGDERTAAVR